MGDGTAEVVSNQPADATIAAAADLARRLGGLDGTLAVVADQPAQIRAPWSMTLPLAFRFPSMPLPSALPINPPVARPPLLYTDPLACERNISPPELRPTSPPVYPAPPASTWPLALLSETWPNML